jgi:tetratricopeptide (TPR) repeat protein
MKVAENVETFLKRDETLSKEVHERWVSVLEPKADYSDLALALCLHLSALKKFSEAIEHAHDMAVSVEDHFFAKLFYRFLTSLRTARVYRKLSSHHRILLLNAIGIFYTRDGQLSEALRIFNAMLAASRRAKNSWGIRQAFLHRGIVWSHLENERQATQNYKQAITWARKEKDTFLLGRVLFNLSQTQVIDDPRLAAKTLEESIRYKRRAGDWKELFSACTGRGILAGSAGDHKAALQWFRKAERAARSTGSLYEQAHSLHNQALSQSRLGKVRAAVHLSWQARTIAETLDQKQLILLTLHGEAAHRYQAQDYNKAVPLFLKLYELKRTGGNIGDAIVALSDTGVCELHLKRYRNASKYLRKAISLAKSTKTWNWLIPSIKNYIEVLKSQKKRPESLRALRQQFSWAKRVEEWGIAAEIGETLARLLLEFRAPAKAVDQVWLQAIDASAKEDNILKQIEVHRQRYVWLRETHPPHVAAGALQPLLELVKRRRSLRKDYIEALDEMGAHLQEQEQYDKAERYYLRALAVAKKELKQEIPSSLLNNYAELLRKTERSIEAIPFYKQAIALDKAKSDINSQLLAKHNLALALDDVGRLDEAVQLFRSIQKMSRKKKLWEHYVRA